MGKRERQQRYRTTGGAAQFVKVETLVPAEGREQILRLAAKLRNDHRARAGKIAAAKIGHAEITHAEITHADIAGALAAFRDACDRQPRRYSQATDPDRTVITSVNVPFPRQINAQTLADSIRHDVVPDEFAGHIERFLGELSVTDILRFCDRHRIAPETLARFVKDQRRRLALHRPELEKHLDAVLSHP